jgi:hypothetical protein
VQDAVGNDAASSTSTATVIQAALPENVTTTTIKVSAATTTTTVAPIPSATTTTLARRQNRTTTTTTTTSLRPIVVTTSTSVPRTVPATSVPTTTTSIRVVATTTTTTIRYPAKEVTSSVLGTAREAEQRLAVAQQVAGSASAEIEIAVRNLALSRLELLDPKSAVVVAIRKAEADLSKLQTSDVAAQQLVTAQERVEALLQGLGESTTISVERIVAAQQRLTALERDAGATPQQVAAARADLSIARMPSFDESAEILGRAEVSVQLPMIIPGVVDAAGGSQAVVFDGMRQVEMTVARINETAVQMRSSDGFVLTIAAVDRRGVPFQINSRGAVVVKHGNYISVVGEGFAPSTVATTWLFSSPRLLGDLSVDAQGRFSAEFRIEDDVQIGDHVAQVTGLSVAGEQRSVNIDVEILGNGRVAPYDPLSEPRNVIDLTAQAVALLTVLGASAARRREEDEEERESADVADVSVTMRSARNQVGQDVFSPPRSLWLDRWTHDVPARLVLKSPMLARVLADPSYLRSLLGWLWLVLPLLGAFVGVVAAIDTGYEVIMPSLAICVALVVLGAFDASAGLVAVCTFGVTVLVAGGIDSSDAWRGLLGLAVFSFAVPLAASAMRPFRRVSDGSDDLWNRITDATLIPLFGAWAAGAMFSALPGLTGFKPEYADEVNAIRIAVLIALVVRWALENVARLYTPKRLNEIENDNLPAPSQAQQVVSAFVRAAVFVFVAVIFIGNNWALWVGGVLYLVPKLVSLVDDNFPNWRSVHRYLPRGLFRVVLMLFVAKWWGGMVADRVADPADMVMIGFVLLGVPGLVLSGLGWFARQSKPWPSTAASKLLGAMLLIIGLVVVL